MTLEPSRDPTTRVRPVPTVSTMSEPRITYTFEPDDDQDEVIDAVLTEDEANTAGVPLGSATAEPAITHDGRLATQYRTDAVRQLDEADS